VHAFVKGAPFGAFIASSPSLFWNGQQEVAALRGAPAVIDGTPRTLFLTMGSERPEMMAGVGAFADTLTKLVPTALDWAYQPMEGKDHEEMPFPSFFAGLEFTFAPLRDQTAIAEAGFEGYLRGLRRRYGYDVLVPVRTLFSGVGLVRRRSCADMVALMDYWNRHHGSTFRRFLDDWLAEGRDRLDAGEAACAVEVFRLLVRTDERSFDAHKGLGDALRATGDRGGALASYREALALEPENDEVRLAVAEMGGQ
jgi:hypothetical protein